MNEWHPQTTVVQICFLLPSLKVPLLASGLKELVTTWTALKIKCNRPVMSRMQERCLLGDAAGLVQSLASRSISGTPKQGEPVFQGSPFLISSFPLQALLVWNWKSLEEEEEMRKEEEERRRSNDGGRRNDFVLCIYRLFSRFLRDGWSWALCD